MMNIVTTINGRDIQRNFVEHLPYNPKLKMLAREKRKAGILSEVLFWLQVRNRQFHKIDFDRQRIIGDYIVDFYVKSLGLVIEIDGSSHDNKAEYDDEQKRFLAGWGLRVYCIDDRDVKQHIGGVLMKLEQYIIDEYGTTPTPP
ncbi:MAG: DUF559 domain-containing protein [Niabella sp.]